LRALATSAVAIAMPGAALGKIRAGVPSGRGAARPEVARAARFPIPGAGAILPGMAAREDERDNAAPQDESGRPTRRSFLEGASALAVAASTVAAASPAGPKIENLAATPPAGFTPMSAPGLVVKVSKPGSLMPNKLYPKPEDAKAMLERAMSELTGKADLPTALSQFIHKDDKVVVKVNGIALRNMSTNKELVLPVVQGLIDMGVKAEEITLLEQYGSFFAGTRLDASNIPKGVKIGIHGNGNATMEFRMVPGTGIQTKFCRFLTEATACINIALVKDHSICGYTGSMKNMTHGTSINPHDFHVHRASPQIAMLYAQDAIRTRVRLNITDAFKVMAHGGPLDKKPEYRFPYEAVMVGTDPVAMDTIGAEIVEEFRKKSRLMTLTQEGRPPAYLQTAQDLGLGIHDRDKITLKEFTMA
jgi:uncharacterized protein (DUF362 family)